MNASLKGTPDWRLLLLVWVALWLLIQSQMKQSQMK